MGQPAYKSHETVLETECFFLGVRRNQDYDNYLR